MNKLPLFCIAAALTLGSCQRSEVKIAGRFVGTDRTTVYLEQVSSLRQQLVDSTTLDGEGNYRFVLDRVSQTPSLYNIVYNGERIPLFLAGGDRIRVQAAGNVVRTYTVEGSAESELLRTFYQDFVGGAQRLDAIAKRLADAALTEAERKELVREYTTEYYRIRREQLAFIAGNKASLAAVYALYQRLPGDTQLLDGASDVIHFRSVAEALETRYPASPYLVTLKGDIARMEAAARLAEEVTEATFPDIEMPDMYGKEIKLSSLEGKVILLHFWSAAIGNGNAINADLKKIYEKYHDRGFEIYQVAVDTSKAAWINAVQEQQLPWISVSDLLGESSPALGVYNIGKLPSNYLIDRSGNIVAKDLAGDKLDAEIQKNI